MIEVVSYPPDLASWDQSKNPFYLEVFGETEPILDMSYAEVLPSGSDTAKTTAVTPIYEYWWTIGHGGQAPDHHHLWPERPSEKPIWNKLEDIAARVYLYFPINAGWRIKELVATVKIPKSRPRPGVVVDGCGGGMDQAAAPNGGCWQPCIQARSNPRGWDCRSRRRADTLDAREAEDRERPSGSQGFRLVSRKGHLRLEKDARRDAGRHVDAPEADVRATWRSPHRQPCIELHPKSETGVGNRIALDTSACAPPRTRRRLR